MPKIFLSDSAMKILLELAIKRGEHPEAVLEKALEAYQRQCFLEESNEAFAALRIKLDWQEEQEERAAWDTTLADGLEEG